MDSCEVGACGRKSGVACVPFYPGGGANTSEFGEYEKWDMIWREGRSTCLNLDSGSSSKLNAAWIHK